MNNKLKEIRQKKKLRQIDLAQLSGVSLTTIWLIEQGQSTSNAIKSKLAKALKMKVKDIF